MKRFIFASAVALAFTFTGSTVVSCGGEKAADARSEEEIKRELMREGYKIDIVESEGYVEKGEWADRAKAANDENSLWRDSKMLR
jgi:hypothetical protein